MLVSLDQRNIMVAVAPVSAREVEDLGSADEADRRGPFRPNRLAPVRERLSGPMLVRLFRGVDIVLAVSLSLLAAALQTPGGLLEQPFGMILPFIVGPLMVLWGLDAIRAYGFGQRDALHRHLARVLAACALGAGSVYLLALGNPQALATAAGWGLATTLALLAAHMGAWLSVRRWRRLGRLTPNIVVVGATDNAARLIESALETREVNVLGIFDDRSDRAPVALRGVPVLGDTTDLLDHKILPYVDRVVITVTSAAQTRVRSLIDRLRILPNAVTLFVDVDGQDTRAATLARLTDAPLAQVSGLREDERRAFWKRVQDLGVGLIALALAAPVMLLIALAIRLEGPGPVLFRQRRHGFNNEAITVLKFRSMRVDATDHTARRQVEKDDERVTRVGRFIRRTSLDELPQLLNVLQGEMSLVGPRPHPIGMLTAGEESQRLVAEYAWRHRMKPGITGWAQINGMRGGIRDEGKARRGVQLDLHYIENWSLLLDLRIMVRTVFVGLAGRDVF